MYLPWNICQRDSLHSFLVLTQAGALHASVHISVQTGHPSCALSSLWPVAIVLDREGADGALIRARKPWAPILVLPLITGIGLEQPLPLLEHK